MRIPNLVVLLCVLIQTAMVSVSAKAAIINFANGKPVIGGNSDYSAGDFNSGGTFRTDNVTDGFAATPNNNTGTITETFGNTGYWLGRQGNSAGYFVLDLGALYSIGAIELFNTSNGSATDRGTGSFTIKASNSVVNLGGTLGFDLSGSISTIASGTLTAQAYAFPSPLTTQSFYSSDNFYYRYIRFDALSIASISAPQGVGLNEIRLFPNSTPIPEPATLTLLALGSLGLSVRSRRCRALAAINERCVSSNCRMYCL